MLFTKQRRDILPLPQRWEIWSDKSCLTYWSICTKLWKWVGMYLCVRGIDVASFHDLFYWILEMFWRCGIAGFSPSSLYCLIRVCRSQRGNQNP